MKCPNCNKELLTVDYIKHTLEHPNMIICPLNCGEVFSTRDYYMRQRGKPCKQRQTKSKRPLEMDQEIDQATEDADVGLAHEATENESDEETGEDTGLSEDIIDFFCMLSDGGCTHKSQNEAAVRLQGFFDVVKAATQAAARKGVSKIQEKLMQAASLELGTFVDEEEIVQEIVDSATVYIPAAVKTQYRREKAMTSTGSRVKGNFIQAPTTFDRPGKKTRKGFAPRPSCACLRSVRGQMLALSVTTMASSVKS